METVTALEAKTRFGKLLERVARGEVIVITRHEKPVARLVPEGRASLDSVRETVAALRNLRKRISTRNGEKAKLTFEETRSAVKEGRR